MTDSPISTQLHHDVLIVTSNNPPVNALGAEVRQGLVAAPVLLEGDGTAWRGGPGALPGPGVPGDARAPVGLY